MILFRVDSNETMGAGHWMRCLTLARACEKAAFVSHEWLEPLKAQAERHGIPVYSDWPDSVPDWVVLDGYHFTLADQERIPHKLLVLDDNREHERYAAQALLNGNLYATPELYRGVDAQLLVGPEYFPLRPEVRRSGRERTTVSNLLVTLGGSSQPEALAAIVHALEQVPGRLQVNLLAPELPLSSGHDLRWLGFRNDLPELLEQADLAITAAGLTVMEALYGGLPVLAVLLGEPQRMLHQALVERQAVLPFTEENLQQLLSRPELRQALSQRGARLIDGEGARRVARFLKAF